MGAAGTWRGFRIWLAAGAVTALACGSAQAATITIGSELGPPSGNPASGVARTWAIAPSAGSNGTQSPVSGTVISWRFRGSTTGLYRPRILRPAEGGAYRAVISGDAQAGAGTAIPAGPFATSLPIAAGDLFAVDVPAARVLSYTDLPGATSIGWNPPLLDGGAPSPPTDTDEGEERQIAATVRYCLVPKLKGKPPKRAKAALRAADCKVGKVKRAKKATRKRKVLGQSAKPGTAISDTQAVNIKVSRKG
jgi:hypothetical protein